jgi:hypothetical protein
MLLLVTIVLTTEYQNVFQKSASTCFQGGHLMDYVRKFVRSIDKMNTPNVCP